MGTKARDLCEDALITFHVEYWQQFEDQIKARPWAQCWKIFLPRGLCKTFPSFLKQKYQDIEVECLGRGQIFDRLPQLPETICTICLTKEDSSK